MSVRFVVACSSVKAHKVLALVSGMVNRSVPIHGVGLQMHVSTEYFPDPAQVADNMRALEKLGLEASGRPGLMRVHAHSIHSGILHSLPSTHDNGSRLRAHIRVTTSLYTCRRFARAQTCWACMCY